MLITRLRKVDHSVSQLTAVIEVPVRHSNTGAYTFRVDSAPEQQLDVGGVESRVARRIAVRERGGVGGVGSQLAGMRAERG